MIVFGHNNFLIRSFTTRELGIPSSPEDPQFKIEVRQRYAHIFWIPFFPIGKVWVLRKPGDPNMYELPDDIKHQALSRHEIKTPWYSFALMILALIGFLVFAGGEKLDDITSENNFYKRQAEKKMMIKYPTTGDFFEFNVYEGTSGYDSKKMVIKVNSYDDNTIEFTSAHKELVTDSDVTYDLDEYMEKSKFKYNATRVDKKELYKLFSKEYRSYGSHRVQIAPFEGYISLDEMKRQDLGSL